MAAWPLCQKKGNMEYLIAGGILVIVVIVATIGTYAAGRVHGRVEGLNEAIHHMPTGFSGTCPTCGASCPSDEELQAMHDQIRNETPLA